MEELSKIDLLYPESDAKNIFVRDDKKSNYYLITIKGSKKVDLKNFKDKYNTRRLSFSSSEDLLNILNLTPGSVTPIGLLNDKDLKVKFYIDKELIDMNMIGVHPNDNTATIWLKTSDLIGLIKEHGNEINIYEE
jgi:Ala-tRNA(Pro) deacylase